MYSTANGELRRSTIEPWIAVILSLFVTGLGHIYCQRITAGVVLFLLSFAYIPVLLVASRVGAAHDVTFFLFFALLGVLFVYPCSALHSYFVAKRAREQDGLRRRIDSRSIYIGMVLAGLVASTVAASGLKAFVFEAYLMPTSSMAPNLIPGDRILVNKMAYVSDAPQRGDIVAFLDPSDPSARRTFVSRVIGLPGDTVAMDRNSLVLNGERLQHEAPHSERLPRVRIGSTEQLINETIGERTYTIIVGGSSESVAETTVPDGCVLLLGDHRSIARDSRHLGVVPIGTLIGKVQFVFWPPLAWSRSAELQNNAPSLGWSDFRMEHRDSRPPGNSSESADLSMSASDSGKP